MTRDEANRELPSTHEARSAAPRIVVGIDGSAPSLGALRWAARQAELTGSTLEVLMTWDWPMAFGWTPMISDYDPEGAVREVLEGAVAETERDHPGIGISTRVVRGHPAQWLVEASKGADLLVVGSRGHGEFVGMLLGSVSEHCVSNGHCPVLVYRDAG
ncbi:MAG TPA: universal stress protein [Acidimicrobiales bacterium]|nr:universal stress protein [Acidimicrobiales bacterium]